MLVDKLDAWMGWGRSFFTMLTITKLATWKIDFMNDTSYLMFYAAMLVWVAGGVTVLMQHKEEIVLMSLTLQLTSLFKQGHFDDMGRSLSLLPLHSWQILPRQQMGVWCKMMHTSLWRIVFQNYVTLDPKRWHISVRPWGDRQWLLQRRYIFLHEWTFGSILGVHRTGEEAVQLGHVLRLEIHQVINDSSAQILSPFLPHLFSVMAQPLMYLII